ncbi:hypothetical protein JTE90_029499 [Oedothorax gibbosus]|uniref:rRNA adenine N(6)-methyltransferase n=1 Tax=Oedothorax gibbosus TaxID=931172 RepID=A0AAV6UGA5_9ARAC|nr:hypothetical protein JTE90_029499 [Oedothorax gibbosus]
MKNLNNRNAIESLGSRNKQIGYLYLRDAVSADFIAKYICENWNAGYIFELNPGPGVLTKAILSIGVPSLRVFEKNEEYLPALKDLSDSHPNLEIIEQDFLYLPSIESKQSTDYIEVLDTFFKGIPEYSWDDRVPLRIFLIGSSKKSILFLRFLLAVLPHRTSIFSYGRCEFFVLLSELEYMKIKAEPKDSFANYRWSTVLYNLFFRVDCLKQFDHEICGPSPQQRNKKKNEDKFLYLVKLSPKPELFSSLVNGNRVPDIYFFIRHHLAKRSGLVIPTMEGWITSCGPRLIKEGMNVFTKFGDLSPKQLLALFNQFSSWPEYENSVFHAAMQRFYGKGPLIEEEDELS